MKIIKFMAAVGLSWAFVFQVSQPVPDIPEKHFKRMDNMLNEIFGPLKPYKTLITGVNAKALMKNLLPGYQEAYPVETLFKSRSPLRH